MILNSGIGMVKTKLEHKALWYGNGFVKVNPKNTSCKCSKCGFTDKNNRKTQSSFKCLVCGFSLNADINAAINIKANGLFVTACGERVHSGSSMKQETAITNDNHVLLH